METNNGISTKPIRPRQGYRLLRDSNSSAERLEAERPSNPTGLSKEP